MRARFDKKAKSWSVVKGDGFTVARGIHTKDMAVLFAAAPDLREACEQYCRTFGLQPLNMFGRELEPDSSAVFKAQKEEMTRRKNAHHVAFDKLRAVLAKAWPE